MRLFNSEAFMRFPRQQRGIGWRRHLPAYCPLLYFLGQRGGWLNGSNSVVHDGDRQSRPCRDLKSGEAIMSRIKIFVSRDWAPIRLGTLTRALPLLLVLGVLITAGALSQAQSNFTIIHTFTTPDGGAYPYSSLTLDRHGNLYGTTLRGGTAGYGNVYELAHVNGSWILHPLYSFTSEGVYDGCEGVTFGPDGTLFGATSVGVAGDFGTLFNLKPPAHIVCAGALCPWDWTTLHSFVGGSDGRYPFGTVVFDSQGNLYGTTAFGGTYNAGTVYKGVRSGGTWNVSVLYSFGADGNNSLTPWAGVVLDSAGNIYGTTLWGGAYRYGTVFKLSPSGGGWTETVLYSFMGSGDGCLPRAALVFDRAGDLYGTTSGDGCGSGTAFELSPQVGGWNFTTLHAFPVNGPVSTLTIDAAGNLYGTNPGIGLHGYDYGNVFELSPSSGGGWTYIDLYDFTGGNDGKDPEGGVAVTGPGGYLYGATRYGGPNGDGLIYQINLGAH